jgi:hypothetical protein
MGRSCQKSSIHVRRRLSVRAAVGLVSGQCDNSFRYIDNIFPGPRGIHFLRNGKLFFPEEYPDTIAG